MKILFIIPSYKPAYGYGGTTVVVSELAEMLALKGHSVTIYTTTANGKVELDVFTSEPVIINGVKVFYFKRITGDHTHISPSLYKQLWKNCKDFDIIHLHSWWSLLIIGSALLCKLRKVTPLVSPHGMLSQYTFKTQNSRLKKYIHQFLGKRLLKETFLHATTQMEWNDCLQVIATWKGFIASNLIELPKGTNRVRNNETFTIGFLSRIDPKKGLEILFKALSLVSFDFKLLIAGTGEDAYLRSLKDLSRQLDIEEKIEWRGWKDRSNKFDFLAELDLFVLTSFNENFAIVVTESLAVGTPVLISENVGLAGYVTNKGLGWTCELDERIIRKKLEDIQKSKETLHRISSISPQVVYKDFEKHKVTQEYINSYSLLYGT